MWSTLMFGLGVFGGVTWAWVTVDAETLDNLNKTCVNNSGIEEVIVTVPRINVYCKDGAEFRLKD